MIQATSIRWHLLVPVMAMPALIQHPRAATHTSARNPGQIAGCAVTACMHQQRCLNPKSALQPAIRMHRPSCVSMYEME